MSEPIKQTASQLYNFVALKERYDTVLTNGQRADIRRARDPDELALMGVFYRLLPDGERPSSRWRRVIFMLPYASHRADAGSLGTQLANKSISEARLFQMVRSEFPNDLLHLRRLLRQAELALDWQRFGELLLYWGEHKKRQIVEDFFLASKPGK